MMADKKLGSSSFLKTYGVPILCVLIAVLLLVAVIRPALAKIQDLKEQQRTAQQLLSTLTAKAKQLSDFSLGPKSKELETWFGMFNQAIPSEDAIPSLLTQVQTISQQHGVRIIVLQYGGGLSGEGAGAMAGPSEVRLQFSSESSFDQLLSLLRALEVTSRLIDVETLQYNMQEGEGGSALQAQLVLVSYYTPEPTLVAEMPISFSFNDPAFKKNVLILNRLTPSP